MFVRCSSMCTCARKALLCIRMYTYDQRVHFVRRTAAYEPDTIIILFNHCLLLSQRVAVETEGVKDVVLSLHRVRRAHSPSSRVRFSPSKRGPINSISSKNKDRSTCSMDMFDEQPARSSAGAQRWLHCLREVSYSSSCNNSNSYVRLLEYFPLSSEAPLLQQYALCVLSLELGLQLLQ